MTKEIWGMHPETGLYVSSHGRIITKRKGVHYGYSLKGYRRVGYDRKILRVHRMVAETFIPNPENKPQVNHKNGNKSDNRVENLEWCTGSENMRHAFDTGLNTPNYLRGEKHGRSKLSKESVLEIRQNIHGLSQRALGAKYGVSQRSVGKIQRGEAWRHLE